MSFRIEIHQFVMEVSRQMLSNTGVSWASVVRGNTVGNMHPLESPYTFWYSKKKNYVDFPAELKRLTRIRTMEEFWKSYSRISRPSELPESNLFLFREGIEPLWEKNLAGGHWQLVLAKGLVSRCWKDLILAMISQQFSVHSSEIAGIGVTVRKEKDWLTIWNRNGSDKEAIEAIRKNVREILKLPSNITLTYRRNSEFTQWDSIRNQTKVLKSLGRWDLD